MPILPHRYERVLTVPGGPTVSAHFVYDLPVAYFPVNFGSPLVCENPFPPDDPRRALTGEILDLLDHSRPERPRRREPWRPDLLEEYGERYLASQRRSAEVRAKLGLQEALDEFDDRPNRLRREARAWAKAEKARAGQPVATSAPAGSTTDPGADGSPTRTA